MGVGDSGLGSDRTVLIHEFVTGGGLADDDLPSSLAREGRAMRRALASDFASVPGVRVLTTVDFREPHSDASGPWKLVRIRPGQELSRVAELATEVDCTLIIAPETGGFLFDRVRMLDQIGVRSLGCTSEGVAVAGNVLLTLDRLRDAGVRIPPTRVVSPRQGWPRRLTFPLSELARVCPFVEVPEPLIDCPPHRASDEAIEHPGVLKPVDGAGATHSYVLAGEVSWPDPAWRPEVAVLQPWIDGKHRSTSILVSSLGRPSLIGCASQRITVDRGRMAYAGGTVPLPASPAVKRMVDQVVEALPGLRGWVGIDWIDDGQGEPIVLEVNPRPTTSIVGFLALLPPGMLANAWLGLFDDPLSPLPDLLSDLVRSAGGDSVSFDPDGTLSSLRDGAGP
ncbi:ATP-grasp domain-containing protein [Tautonia rosea]|uniref:ATP-grasp domain-containing protein n=1 Tax=Tautonia rosea TaxID=2728037 RepID=UPI00147546C7|nr:ATP-grasp domain-containing protein [Tautonia rosea]